MGVGVSWVCFSASYAPETLVDECRATGPMISQTPPTASESLETVTTRMHVAFSSVFLTQRNMREDLPSWYPGDQTPDPFYMSQCELMFVPLA